MSDEGDRTCPLCAEEMDITDQQLKPCKCGYEICVWCWHHIMEMAEKEETEGRCPACRTAYDKDRIVKMAASCQRMVAEITAEKKQKPQKVKAKSTVGSIDARNHLTSVRVIQRNLVYIIGLPNNLMDESLLERREYFGQYGKVMKVSISRPTGAAAQQALANNTFSVYITYGREEEAVRCIQAVHNFILEGKSLRACFGTTKYCHQWLRNLSCNNPDCLYLHDIGSQEDSFTKDEIISAYTRSRVPQIVLNASLRRAGSILPPPADDFASSISISSSIPTKPPLKNGSNIVTTQAKTSPPNSSSGKSTLPAAASWGLRNLSPRPTSAGPSQTTLTKHKSDPSLNMKQTSSAWHDDIIPSTSTSSSKIPETKVENSSKAPKQYKSCISKELDIDLTNIPSAWNDDPPIVTSCKSYEVLNGKTSPHISNQNLEVSSSPVPKQSSPFGLERRDNSASYLSNLSQSIELPIDSLSEGLSSVCLDTEYATQPAPVLNVEIVPEIFQSTSNNHNHNHNRNRTPGLHEQGTTNYDPLALRDNSSIVVPNGSYNPRPVPVPVTIFDSLGGTATSVNTTTEESNIISDILALDFDPWDESSSLSSNITAPWRCKNTGQSRFLFARQDGDFLEGSGNTQNNTYQNGLDNNVSGLSGGFVRNGPGLPGNSRTKVSAPPGFSAPNRAVPPPGFDRSSNHFYDPSYSENQHYQQGNMNLSRNSPDIEFIDPAILAVGKGRMAGMNEPGLVDPKPVYHSSHFNSSPSNTDPRIHMLMQQALAPQQVQNSRMLDHNVRDSSSYLMNDGTNGGYNGNLNYGGSRFLGQNFGQVSSHQQQHQRNAHLNNGGVQWDGWSDLRMGNSMGMSEILRNERAMLNGNNINNNNNNNNNNNLYGGNDENSFRLPGTNDMFNRAFGL